MSEPILLFNLLSVVLIGFRYKVVLYLSSEESGLKRTCSFIECKGYYPTG